MSQQTWEEALIARTTDATQIVSSTAETIMVPDTALPANYWYAGRTVRVRLIGVLSNIVTTPGTITFRSRFTSVAGTLLAASDALTMSATAHTNGQIEIEFLITCRSAGTAGSLFTSGKVFLGKQKLTTSPDFPGEVDMIPSSGNAVVGSLDLQSASVLSFTAQFNTSNAGNNLTINQFLFEALN